MNSNKKHDIPGHLANKQEMVRSEEVYLLRRIASASSDLLRAQDDTNFCEMGGGIPHFRNILSEAVSTYEQWVDDSEE